MTDLVSTPPESGVFPFYDSTAATSGCTSEPNPDQKRTGNIILKKLSGGATAAELNPPTREIEYKYQAGAYLAGKRFRQNGAALGWWAFERDRDPSTGLISEVRDTAGVRTQYAYDGLGRLTRIEPDAVFGTEHATEIRYPSLVRTVLLQGPPATLGAIPHGSASPCTASGDFTCTEYRYDGLARLIETRKRRIDATLAAEHRCYTPSGKPSEHSEWVSQSDWDTDNAPFPCGQPSGPPRTRTYYSPAADTRSDPLGRPRRVETADSFLSEYEYSGQKTTIKVHTLQDPTDPTGVQTTVQVKDAFDRLIWVDSDGAADAVYTYDSDDHLVEVALGVFRTGVPGEFLLSPEIQHRHFVYDRLGRMTEEAHPENGRTRYLAFDPLGSVTQRQDARGLTFRSTYDAAGRLVDEDLETTQGWRLLSHNVYDSGALGIDAGLTLGKLTRMESFDDTGNLVYRRDLRYTGLNSRLDREETLLQGWNALLRTTYRYNSLGLLEQVDYPGDPAWSVPLLASYQYTNGYLTRAETQNAPRNLVAKAMTYNQAGALQSWEGGNATHTMIQPDLRNRPARIYVDRLSVDQVSARLLDPEALDANFSGLLAGPSPSPHQVIAGSEPTAEQSPTAPGDVTQAASEPRRDPPGGGSNVEDTYSECHDGIDNDSDSAVDCADSGCTVACTPEESYDACTNSIDDNSNGLIDCQDPSCQTLFCTTQKAEATSDQCADCCTDRKDNDWDGLIDCADPDCTASDPLACRYWDSGAFEYDGAGNVKAMRFGPTSGDFYWYDHVNRLSVVSLAIVPNNPTFFYYDEFGNLTRWQTNIGFNPPLPNRWFEIDAATNRVIGPNGPNFNFGYDAAGNLTADERYRYEYDSRNRLIRIRDLAGAIASEFAYDATGNRIMKTESGKSTYYLRDYGGRVLTEFVRAPGAVAPKWTKAYLHAGQQQVGFLSAGVTEVKAPEKAAARVIQISQNKFAIRVYWKSAPGGTYYVVYRRSDTAPQAALFTTPISGNWYDDGSSLVSDQAYYYTVQAVDRYGFRSPHSSEFRIVFRHSDATAPTWADPPTVVGLDSVTLRWVPSTSPYAVGYIVKRNSTVLNEWISCQVSTLCYFPIVGSEYVDNDVPGGDYKVCSVGSNGVFTDSLTYCTPQTTVSYTGPTPPQPSPELVQAPLGFRALAHLQDASRIDLSWSRLSPSSVSSYEVLNEADSGLQSLMSGISANASSYILSEAHGIQPNMHYRLRLRAYDTQGAPSPLSEIAEVRTRSLNLGVPSFRIHKNVCEPITFDSGPRTACDLHMATTRSGYFWGSIEDTVPRTDTASRYGFRLYFRTCNRSSVCSTWKSGQEVDRLAQPFWDARGFEQIPPPSLTGIFSTEMEGAAPATGEPSIVVPRSDYGAHCVGRDPAEFVCARPEQVPHGCEIGEYAFSTVRGHIDNGVFVVDEESLLSDPQTYNPYDLFRNVRINDPSAPGGYRIQKRAWTSCTVRAAGIAKDGHLYTGSTCSSKSRNGEIIGYRVYWMPIPYCGVKGYNVYKIKDCAGCSKGPQGQLALQSEDVNLNNILDTGTCSDTGAACVNDFDCSGSFFCGEGLCRGEEDLNCNRKLDGELVKINSEPITGHHFDIYPTLNADGKFDYVGTNILNLERWVTIEAVLDDSTQPTLNPPNETTWDRFSCPRTVAQVESPGLQVPQYLSCGGGLLAPGGDVNGTCWCGPMDGQGYNGCYMADYVAGTYVGSYCNIDGDANSDGVVEDVDGWRYTIEIWAKMQDEAESMGADAPQSFGCRTPLLLARTGSAQRTAAVESMPAPDTATMIAGIAQPMEEANLQADRLAIAPESSMYQSVGQTAMPLNEVVYYHTDHLGSVRLTTDRRGYKVRETVYWPFGQEASPVASDSNTHRFTGHERHVETGLDYMLARYYSAGLSRFLSVDPLGASARLENPQSWNRYSYVLNNPVNLTDPDGRDALGDAKKAAAKIASVKAGPAAGAEVKIKAGPVKAQAGASVSASVKVDSGGNVSVQAEKSAGAKVGVGSVEAGLHTSSQTTTVKNGEALGTPEVASQTTVGVSSKGVSAESTGEISVEATIGVAKVGASFNPVAVVEAAVKGAIAVREALHNLATTPSPSWKPKE